MDNNASAKTLGNNSPAQKISNGRAIMILVICMAIMIASGFAQFKFPPILTTMLEYYQIDMGAFSIVMSVFQWVCIIAMVPVGLILSRISPKLGGVIGAVAIVVGNLAGMFASTIALLVIGRIIEGLGYCILQVLTQSLVTNAFKDNPLKGSATGILNTGMLIGQMIHYNVSANILKFGGGLRGVYMYIIVVVAVLAVLWAILISGKTQAVSTGPQLSKAEKRKHTLAVYASRDMWLVAIACALIRVAVAGVGTYIPAYLETARGMTNAAASGITSIATALGIISLIAYGTVSDILKTKRKLMIFSCFSVIAVYLCLMKLPVNIIIIAIILYGTLPRAFTTLTFSCYPEIFDDPSVIPVAHSLVHFCMNLVSAIGTIVFGYVIELMGYDALWILVMILGVLGGILWIFVRKVK